MLFICLGSTVLPVHFQADKEGHYECRVLVKSGYDLRIIYIESTVSAKEKIIQIEFNTQAIRPLTQNIPVVSKCFSGIFVLHDLRLRATVWLMNLIS